MKRHDLIGFFVCSIISFLPTYGSNVQTNQMTWVVFTSHLNSDTNWIATVKENIADHLNRPFQRMYKRATFVFDDQSWIQSRENVVFKFSGQLDFNQGISSGQERRVSSPFRNIQGGPVGLSFPTQGDGFSSGELYGMLIVEDPDGVQRKFPIGKDEAMRIRFGLNPRKLDTEKTSTSE